MYAKKSLGQHFLTAPSVAEALCEAAQVTKKDVVLEIGPGTGILTEKLLARGAYVIAIEKDARMIPVLQERFKKEIKEKRFELREEDALETKKPKGTYKIVANIPYYITGLLVRTFLTAQQQPASITFLVQKEVAERISRNTKESILSLSVKAYGTPRYVQTVKAGSFAPAPKVDSAILHIAHISRKNFKNKKEEARFFEIVKAGFAQKRKTLGGNLGKLTSKEAVAHAFELLNIPTKTRAEDVPLEKWLALAKNL